MMSVSKAIEDYEKYSDFDEERNRLLRNMSKVKKERWKVLRDICIFHFNLVKSKVPFVDINFDTCLKLYDGIRITAATAKKEVRMKGDNNCLFLRFLGGTLGEYAVCEYFGLDKRKMVGSPGGSYTNDFADLLPWGYKIGVKNSKVGNSVKINKYYLYDQIICQYEILDIESNHKMTIEEKKQKDKFGMHKGQKVRVYICGVLTEKLQKFFCDRELVESEDLYNKNSKVGFIDYEYCETSILYSKNSFFKYKIDLQIENILFSSNANPTEYLNFLTSKSNFVYVELDNLNELTLYKYIYNDKYKNISDSDNVDINNLFICKEMKKIEFFCFKPYKFNLSKSEFREYQKKIKEILLFCSKSVVIGYGVRGVLHTFQSIYCGKLKGSLYYLDLSMVINNDTLCELMSYNFIDNEKNVWNNFLSVYKDISAFNYVHNIRDTGILSYHRIFEWLLRKSEDKVKLKECCKNYIYLFDK